MKTWVVRSFILTSLFLLLLLFLIIVVVFTQISRTSVSKLTVYCFFFRISSVPGFYFTFKFICKLAEEQDVCWSIQNVKHINPFFFATCTCVVLSCLSPQCAFYSYWSWDGQKPNYILLRSIFATLVLLYIYVAIVFQLVDKLSSGY